MTKINGPAFKVMFGYSDHVFIPATPDGLRLINLLSSSPTATQKWFNGKIDGKHEHYVYMSSEGKVQIEYLAKMPTIYDSEPVPDREPEEIANAA